MVEQRRQPLRYIHASITRRAADCLGGFYGPAVNKHAQALEQRLLTGTPRPTDRFWAEPARVMAEAGMAPDAWQGDVLRSHSPRMLLCCTRQGGKSAVAAGLALLTAFVEAPALILLLSPTLRQSGELSSS